MTRLALVIGLVISCMTPALAVETEPEKPKLPPITERHPIACKVSAFTKDSTKFIWHPIMKGCKAIYHEKHVTAMRGDLKAAEAKVSAGLKDLCEKAEPYQGGANVFGSVFNGLNALNNLTSRNH